FVNFAAFQNTQARIVKAIRFWDLAKTKPNKKNPDPDWTVGVLLWLDNFGKLWIKDVVYLRDTPEVCGELIYRTALKDGSATSIGFETEPGGMSGYGLNYLTQRLNGFNTTVRETTNKSKANRITNASSFTEKHGVNIIGLSDTGKMLPWVEFFLGQLLPYPSAGYHDDCVDAYGGAFYSMGLNIENPRQLIYDNYGRRRSKGLRAF
ncbi:MAG: hypothetical protein LBU40_04140, partial [Methanobrevibacter sp.]|nr:hypothetical protein [Methanobrevibacter sp.]